VKGWDFFEGKWTTRIYDKDSADFMTLIYDTSTDELTLADNEPDFVLAEYGMYSLRRKLAQLDRYRTTR
jgi:hypothetical protein